MTVTLCSRRKFLYASAGLWAGSALPALADTPVPEPNAKHEQKILYPTGKVTPGGITDRLLGDYPNMFGDHSAGSGLNFLVRDPEQAAAFLDRHQDKLLFGSDCDDILGAGPGCQGAQILANLRKLAPSKKVERKILYENAKKLLKL